jgi:hypothetical protein
MSRGIRFLKEKWEDISMLQNEVWISKQAFFIDILKYVNEFSIKLKGKNQLISDILYGLVY